MKERRAYKGKTIEAQSLELRAGKGWDSAFFVEEDDNGAVLVTQFVLRNIFPTAEAAIQAAFDAGREKIDSGFERKSVVENLQVGERKPNTSVKVTAVIKKESKVDPKKPNEKALFASLVLLNENEKPYGVPRYFSGFPEVGDRLKREAGVTHEQLQDRFPRYERGDEVRILLTLKNEEAIRNLGFDPKAA
jgi:hypothetical protein